MTISIKINRNDLALKNGAIKAAVAQEIRRAAFALEAREKEIIVEKDVIDTGALLNGTQAVRDSDDGLRWIVGNAQEYSAAQNYGTVFIPARPFVEPAVDDVRPQFIENMKRAIKDA